MKHSILAEDIFINKKIAFLIKILTITLEKPPRKISALMGYINISIFSHTKKIISFITKYLIWSLAKFHLRKSIKPKKIKLKMSRK
jgi:hypothetical protein